MRQMCNVNEVGRGSKKLSDDDSFGKLVIRMDDSDIFHTFTDIHPTHKTCTPFPNRQDHRKGDTANANVSKQHF